MFGNSTLSSFSFSDNSLSTPSLQWVNKAHCTFRDDNVETS